MTRPSKVSLSLAALCCLLGTVAGLSCVHQLAFAGTLLTIVAVGYTVQFGTIGTPYRVILYLLTLGLVWQTTLLSPFLIGTDIHAEFYHTLTNNCTTNIRDHINRLSPNRVPYDYRVLLPGNSDKLAFELGLLDTDTTFEQTRLRNRVNYRAYVYRDDPEFSTKIRR